MNTFKFKNAQNILMRMEIGDHYDPNNAFYVSGNVSSSTGKKACGWCIDNGGETKYGIAQKFWPRISVRDLNAAAAEELYMKEYWIPSQAEIMPDRLAVCYYDAVVNMGISAAGKLLQRVIGAKADGEVGPKTIQKLQELLKTKTDIELSKSFQNARISFYHLIAHDKDDPNTPQNEDIHGQYERGWLNRINKINKLLLL